MKRILSLALALAGLLGTSCNTTIGVGRDMRILGENMENAANKARGGSGSYDDSSGAPVY